MISTYVMGCAACFCVCINVIINDRILAQVFFMYEYFQTNVNSVLCPARWISWSVPLLKWQATERKNMDSMNIVIRKAKTGLGWGSVTALYLMMKILSLSFKIIYILYDFIFDAVLTV